MNKQWMLALLLVVTLQVSAAGLSYHNETNGYRFEVQPGWMQVPDAVLAGKRKLMPPEGHRLGLDAAFQLGNSGEWMAYPYITIQPVGPLTNGRPITEAEFEKLISSLRAVNRLPEMKARLASMSRKSDGELLAIFIEAAANAKVVIDTSRRKYWMVVPSPYGKDLYALLGGTVLSNGMLIQINGSIKKANLKAVLPAFMRMFDSLRDL